MPPRPKRPRKPKLPPVAGKKVTARKAAGKKGTRVRSRAGLKKVTNRTIGF